MGTQRIVNKFGTILFEKPGTEFKSQKELVELAVKEGFVLRGADNLSGAQLDYANLREAELRHANLVETNLVKAVLADADLSRTNLQGSTLYDAVLQRITLSCANLTTATLKSANLHAACLFGANLTNANLSNTNLTFCLLAGANLKYTLLPSPTMVLLADWGSPSDELTADLMVWDSLNHPNPDAFKVWADGGICPYSEVTIQRAANFKEKRQLWGKGKVCSPYELMQRVLAEKCPPWTKEQEQEFDHQFDTEVKGDTE